MEDQPGSEGLFRRTRVPLKMVDEEEGPETSQYTQKLTKKVHPLVRLKSVSLVKFGPDGSKYLSLHIAEQNKQTKQRSGFFSVYQSFLSIVFQL